jgi:hypothetical protein
MNPALLEGFEDLALACEEGPKYKSKMESEWAERLELLRIAGEIIDYKYEPISVILADGRTYKVDFLVKRKDRIIEAQEIKGWHPNIRDSRTRWLVAAEMLPWFLWKFCVKKKGKWYVETYGERKERRSAKLRRNSKGARRTLRAPSGLSPRRPSQEPCR